MIYRFLPTGHLDLTTDPSELPETSDGARAAASGDMVRCTNLRLDELGTAQTRRGSAKVAATATSGGVNHLREMQGYRYLFTEGGAIY